MKPPEIIFFTRVLLGRPFNRKTKKHKQDLDSAQETATREVRCLESVFPKYDPLIMQSEIDRLAENLAISGSKANYAHAHVLAAAIQYLIYDRKIDFPSLLEIGTAKGFGSMCMSLALRTFTKSSLPPPTPYAQVHTIDFLPHDKKFFWGTQADLTLGKVTRKKLWQRIGRGLDGNIRFERITSKEFTSNQLHLSRNHYDMVFIDGGHDYDSVIRELRFADSHGSTVIIVDDYNAKFPGISSAIDQFSFESSLYQKFDLSSSPIRKYAVFILKR